MEFPMWQDVGGELVEEFCHLCWFRHHMPTTHWAVAPSLRQILCADRPQPAAFTICQPAGTVVTAIEHLAMEDDELPGCWLIISQDPFNWYRSTIPVGMGQDPCQLHMGVGLFIR